MTSRSTFRVCVLFFCLLLHIPLVTNNRIIMSATPAFVISQLSDSLNVTCKVGDDLKGGRTLDITYITSITLHLVTERNELFGTVRLYLTKPERGWALPSNATIRGGLEKHSSAGFIEVLWPNPKFTKSKVGTFKCTVEGYPSVGRNVKLEASADVRFELPSVSILFTFAQDLLSKIKEINATREALVSKALEIMPHVEAGKIKCKGDCGCKTIIFDKPYNTTPSVAYAPVRLDIPYNDNIRLSMYTLDLNNTSFRLCGFKWEDTYFYALYMTWMSFGY